jgi:hypothetical protein
MTVSGGGPGGMGGMGGMGRRDGRWHHPVARSADIFRVHALPFAGY